MNNQNTSIASKSFAGINPGKSGINIPSGKARPGSRRTPENELTKEMVFYRSLWSASHKNLRDYRLIESWVRNGRRVFSFTAGNSTRARELGIMGVRASPNKYRVNR
jgi:hypothetical protein